CGLSSTGWPGKGFPACSPSHPEGTTPLCPFPARSILGAHGGSWLILKWTRNGRARRASGTAVVCCYPGGSWIPRELTGHAGRNQRQAFDLGVLSHFDVKDRPLRNDVLFPLDEVPSSQADRPQQHDTGQARARRELHRLVAFGRPLIEGDPHLRRIHGPHGPNVDFDAPVLAQAPPR